MSKPLKPQHLTLSQVKRANQKALRASRLTAQALDSRDRICIYTHNERGCAIGVALSPSTLKEIVRRNFNHACAYFTLIKSEILTSPPQDVCEIGLIQAHHDSWAGALPAERDGCRRDFLKQIYKKIPKDLLEEKSPL